MDSWQRAALNGVLHPLHEEKLGRTIKWYENSMSQLHRRAQHAGAGAHDESLMAGYKHNLRKLEAISAACRKHLDTKQIVQGDESTKYKIMTLAHKYVQGTLKV
jgi:hypothetical protein